VKLNGRLFHYFPKAFKKSGCYFFIYSNDNALEELGQEMHVDPQFLLEFKNFLEGNNRLNRQYRFIGDAIQDLGNDVEAYFDVQTHDFEIASVTSQDFRGEKVVRVVQKGSLSRPTSISINSHLFEPLCYPLLFLYGEPGWSKSIAKAVSHSQYMASRILMPDLIDVGDEDNTRYLIGYAVEDEPEKFVPTNRFQTLYRVGQTWIVDNTARIVDDRLKWHDDHKKHIFGRGRIDDDGDEANPIETDAVGDNESETEVGENEDESSEPNNDNDLSDTENGNSEENEIIELQADDMPELHYYSDDDNGTFYDTLPSAFHNDDDDNRMNDSDGNSDFGDDPDPAARYFGSLANETTNFFDFMADVSDNEDHEGDAESEGQAGDNESDGGSDFSDNEPHASSSNSPSASNHDESSGNARAKESKYKKSFLSETVHGSRRALKKRAINALSLVSELGKAHCFLTVTCNTNWPELVQALGNLTAYDNPTITNRIFHQKLEALLKNLRSGQYFDGRETAYDIRVIEYQHRGLPHAHIVFRLKDVEFANVDEEIEFIDKYFCAEVPSEDDDPEYHALVMRYMIHRHSTGVNGCRRKNGKGCKKGFTKTSIGPSGIDENGYPYYRRSKDIDKSVVVHNREILIDWNGHACLEFATSTNTLMYLYKVDIEFFSIYFFVVMFTNSNNNLLFLSSIYSKGKKKLLCLLRIVEFSGMNVNFSFEAGNFVLMMPRGEFCVIKLIPPRTQMLKSLRLGMRSLLTTTKVRSFYVTKWYTLIDLMGQSLIH
jgi:hypothetical protein